MICVPYVSIPGKAAEIPCIRLNKICVPVLIMFGKAFTLELRDGRELRMSRTDQHDNQFDSAKLPRAERDGADVGLFVSWDDLSNERKNVRD